MEEYVVIHTLQVRMCASYTTYLEFLRDFPLKKEIRGNVSLSPFVPYTSLRWHYPNQVMGRSSQLPLSLVHKLPICDYKAEYKNNHWKCQVFFANFF